MNAAIARIDRLPVARPESAHRFKPALVWSYETRKAAPLLQMRKLKYHVSISVDGYLLDDGCGSDIDLRTDDPDRYLQTLHAYGIVLMGSRTYASCLQAGIENPYPHLMVYVFSRTTEPQAGQGVEIVNEDATAWVRRMKACPGKDIYLLGGTRLAMSLLRAGLIDEMIVKVHPVLRGEGARLPFPLDAGVSLNCGGGVVDDKGVVSLTYRPGCTDAAASPRPMLQDVHGKQIDV